MRIGFERESYTTSEPSGAVQVAVDVCMVVLSGAVGRQLSIAAQWQPGTAQSKYKQKTLYCSFTTVKLPNFIIITKVSLCNGFLHI